MVTLHAIFDEMPCYVIAVRGTDVQAVAEEQLKIIEMLKHDMRRECGPSYEGDEPVRITVRDNNYIIVCLNTDHITPKRFYEIVRGLERPPMIILMTLEEYMAEVLGVSKRIVENAMHNWWYKQRYGDRRGF